MIQELQHCSLDLSVARLVIVESFGPDGIYFIDENDGRSFFFGEGEGVPDHLRPVSDVHLHETGTCKFEECRLGLSSTCPGHHGFAGAWRAEHQAALWWPDSNILELLLMSNGENNSFSELLNLFIEATNVCILFGWSFLYLHGPDPRVILSRELLEQNIRVLVNAN